MKTFARPLSTVLALGTALAFTVSVARADDIKPKHHRHAAKTEQNSTLAQEKSTHTVKGSNTIPTRDDRNSREVNGNQVGGANGPEYRVQTGSNLPRHYNRKGYTTDSDQNSFIYDKNDQRLRSHNNVGESLRDVPGVMVSGPRSL